MSPKESGSRIDFPCSWVPLGDIKESKSAITVYIDLPGVDEDDLTIRYENGLLVVFGEREFDHDNEDAEEYTTIDRPYGRFRYKIGLEGPLDSMNVTAKYKRGVLKIRIPKMTSLCEELP